MTVESTTKKSKPADLRDDNRTSRRLLIALKYPKGIIGLSLVGGFAFLATLAPLLIPESLSTAIDITARHSPPSFEHILGTDKLGRDLFFRVLLGAKSSLLISVSAVVLMICLGLPVGLIAGYFRGWTDLALMRIVDSMLSFPVLVFALAIAAILEPNLRNTVIAIGIAFSPYLARVVRAETLRGSALPFVEAARAVGSSHSRIIVTNILPNIMGPVIVQATISIAFAILTEAGLSFLGLGTQPPTPSWGLMIQSARSYLDVAPWTALVPGMAIAFSVLGLNMLGDVLRDALDPRLRIDR